MLICGGDPPAPNVLSKFRDLARDQETKVITVRPGDDISDESWNVLPGSLVVCGPFDQQVRSLLLAAVTKHPGHVGICLNRGAALAIRGRQLDVLGEASIHILLAAAAGRPLREIELQSGARHDLTMLRRSALERSLGAFPSQVPPAPGLASGSLVIVGGGSLPAEITSRFIDLAGGPSSPIVVLPIAAGDELSGDEAGDTRLLVRAGATNVKSLRARRREEVETPEFAAALSAAKGVWFNGGRQWRFVDAYLGTKAEELFRGVLARGGVMGGSSAGASIQGQYMPRGSPLGNLDMLADGYERGLGFLPGVAIDQHFTQRKRHRDMSGLVHRYPQLLGIGIDESTAIVVCQQSAEVIGRGKVFFYDHRTGIPAGPADYTAVSNGQTYDLVQRCILNAEP
jgi:cyanophycinase